VAGDRVRQPVLVVVHGRAARLREAREAYGHVGIRVDRPQDVEGALRDAFGKHKDRTVFLDIITDQTENVWPMVQGGKGLTEMLLGSEDL
jgi:acetolactate synthase-1/2/3 large subunit